MNGMNKEREIVINLNIGVDPDSSQFAEDTVPGPHLGGRNDWWGDHRRGGGID